MDNSPGWDVLDTSKFTGNTVVTNKKGNTIVTNI